MPNFVTNAAAGVGDIFNDNEKNLADTLKKFWKNVKNEGNYTK